jgi:hypothetical protein
MKLKVGFLPLYNLWGPSSRYRMFQFLEPLQRQGIGGRVMEAPERNFVKRVKFLPGLFRMAATHDVLFVQKRTFPAWVLHPLRRINPRIVYDMDDAVFLKPEQYGPVDLMLQHAHTIIAGNDYLADYASRHNPRVVTLPTVIDTRLYAPPDGPRHPGDDRVYIGWIGSDPNFGSLELLQPVFEWLAKRYGERVVFRVIGRAPLKMDTPLRQEFLPWDMQRSRQDLKSFDLGLMPLEDGLPGRDTR